MSVLTFNMFKKTDNMMGPSFIIKDANAKSAEVRVELKYEKLSLCPSLSLFQFLFPSLPFYFMFNFGGNRHNTVEVHIVKDGSNPNPLELQRQSKNKHYKEGWSNRIF